MTVIAVTVIGFTPVIVGENHAACTLKISFIDVDKKVDALLPFQV
jgi:hypothetical protein